MQLPRFLVLLFAFAIALTLPALGEVKDWRSPQHGFRLQYNTDIWTATAPDRLVAGNNPHMQLAFFATNVDRTVDIAVRITPTAATQIDEALLKTFADSFARSAERAGKKNTVEWTQTDFTTEAGCIFRVHYEDANPNTFMVGRLVMRDGKLFQIVAISKVASEPLRAEAEGVLRTFTFR